MEVAKSHQCERKAFQSIITINQFEVRDFVRKLWHNVAIPSPLRQSLRLEHRPWSLAKNRV